MYSLFDFAGVQPIALALSEASLLVSHFFTLTFFVLSLCASSQKTQIRARLLGATFLDRQKHSLFRACIVPGLVQILVVFTSLHRSLLHLLLGLHFLFLVLRKLEFVSNARLVARFVQVLGRRRRRAAHLSSVLLWCWQGGLARTATAGHLHCVHVD